MKKGYFLMLFLWSLSYQIGWTQEMGFLDERGEMQVVSSNARMGVTNYDITLSTNRI